MTKKGNHKKVRRENIGQNIFGETHSGGGCDDDDYDDLAVIHTHIIVVDWQTLTHWAESLAFNTRQVGWVCLHQDHSKQLFDCLV